MELKDFVVQACKSRLAFEFLPRKKENLELEKIAQQLKTAGFPLEVETNFLLMTRIGKHGISLFRSGKIIVKETESETDARQIAQQLIQKIK